MNLQSFLIQISTFFVIFFYCDLFALETNQIVVVITSYNNAKYYQKNLDSVFNQDYENFSVIYIDDCSPDGTGDLVENYIKEHGKENLVVLIKNKQNESQMANHYKAVHMCPDDAIIVHVDGDDWLAHEQVLSRINEIYCTEDVWLTYGQAIEYPSGRVSFARELYPNMVTDNAFRDYPFIFSHLRTFYAWLFKQIKLKDLLMDGTFRGMDPAPDAAFMYPMTEMAGKHVRFVPEVLYVKYCENPLSQCHLDAQRQIACDETIRKWEKYQPLKEKKKYQKGC